MVLRYNPPVVAKDASAEMLRQAIKKMDHWNCPLLTQDPGFGQMPPGMLWIRTDMVGCERYRFYDENGNVVTLCGDDGDEVGTQSLDLKKSMSRVAASPDIVSNTTTETDFATQYTIPANSAQIDDLFRVHIAGANRVDAVVSAGLRLRLYCETFPVFDSTNLVINAPNTNVPWDIFVDFVVEDATEFGEMQFAGVAHIAYGTAVSPSYLIRPFNAGAGTGVGFTGTSDQVIKVSADWDTADTDNQAELTMFNVIKGRVGGL